MIKTLKMIVCDLELPWTQKEEGERENSIRFIGRWQGLEEHEKSNQIRIFNRINYTNVIAHVKDISVRDVI